MSPLDRLGWLRVLAGTDAPACAWKVAAVLADHVNSETGLAWPGLRTALGVDAAKRGARWLATAGMIEVVEAPPGKPAVYRLTRGNAAPGAELHRVQISTPTRGNAAPGDGAGLPREGGQPCPPNQGYQGLNQGDEPGSDRTGTDKPIDAKARKTSERFSKPTLTEVETYCTERDNGIDSAHFVDHYEANGWRVGKTPMRDWRAAVRTWERKRRLGPASSNQLPKISSTVPNAEPWRSEAWAKSLADVGCKIGSKNWPAWKSLCDRWPVARVVEIAATIDATSRWPDDTEQALKKSGGQSSAAAIAKKTIVLNLGAKK